MTDQYREQYKKETEQIHAPAALIARTKAAMREEEARIRRELTARTAEPEIVSVLSGQTAVPVRNRDYVKRFDSRKQLLIAWRSTGKTPIFELADFREKLGVDKTDYAIISDLKKRVLDISVKQLNEHTDITVEYEQHKKGRSIYGFSFLFKNKQTEQNLNSTRDPNTVDLVSKMTKAQRHLFANKLSQLPEMSKYSQGTESFPQFAIRIADMLQDPHRAKELYPYLEKVGFMSATKNNAVNN